MQIIKHRRIVEYIAMINASHIGLTNFCLESEQQIFFMFVCRSLFAFCILQMECIFKGLDQCSEEEKVQRLLKLKLRYFTSREVANLMGFPQNFCTSTIFIFTHLCICESACSGGCRIPCYKTL